MLNKKTPSHTKSFFGYKEHIAMTEEEIIMAVEVIGGSSDDGKQLEKIFLESTVLFSSTKSILQGSPNMVFQTFFGILTKRNNRL